MDAPGEPSLFGRVACCMRGSRGPARLVHRFRSRLTIENRMHRAGFASASEKGGQETCAAYVDTAIVVPTILFPRSRRKDWGENGQRVGTEEGPASPMDSVGSTLGGCDHHWTGLAIPMAGVLCTHGHAVWPDWLGLSWPVRVREPVSARRILRPCDAAVEPERPSAGMAAIHDATVDALRCPDGVHGLPNRTEPHGSSALGAGLLDDVRGDHRDRPSVGDSQTPADLVFVLPDRNSAKRDWWRPSSTCHRLADVSRMRALRARMPHGPIYCGASQRRRAATP